MKYIEKFRLGRSIRKAFGGWKSKYYDTQRENELKTTFGDDWNTYSDKEQKLLRKDYDKRFRSFVPTDELSSFNYSKAIGLGSETFDKILADNNYTYENGALKRINTDNYYSWDPTKNDYVQDPNGVLTKEEADAWKLQTNHTPTVPTALEATPEATPDVPVAPQRPWNKPTQKEKNALGLKSLGLKQEFIDKFSDPEQFKLLLLELLANDIHLDKYGSDGRWGDETRKALLEAIRRGLSIEGKINKGIYSGSGLRQYRDDKGLTIGYGYNNNLTTINGKTLRNNSDNSSTVTTIRNVRLNGKETDMHTWILSDGLLVGLTANSSKVYGLNQHMVSPNYYRLVETALRTSPTYKSPNGTVFRKNKRGQIEASVNNGKGIWKVVYLDNKK